jgi:hypothetical protein
VSSRTIDDLRLYKQTHATGTPQLPGAARDAPAPLNASIKSYYG